MAIDAWSGSVPADACPYVTRGAFELCPDYEPAPAAGPAGMVTRCAEMSPVLAEGPSRAYIRCRRRAEPLPAVPIAD